MDRKILHSSASFAYAATTRLAWLAVLWARGSTSPISPGSDFVGIPNCKGHLYSVAAARQPGAVCRPCAPASEIIKWLEYRPQCESVVGTEFDRKSNPSHEANNQNGAGTNELPKAAAALLAAARDGP
jgi:hypothetical protein